MGYEKLCCNGVPIKRTIIPLRYCELINVVFSTSTKACIPLHFLAIDKLDDKSIFESYK